MLSYSCKCANNRSGQSINIFLRSLEWSLLMVQVTGDSISHGTPDWEQIRREKLLDHMTWGRGTKRKTYRLVQRQPYNGQRYMLLVTSKTGMHMDQTRGSKQINFQINPFKFSQSDPKIQQIEKVRATGYKIKQIKLKFKEVIQSWPESSQGVESHFQSVTKGSGKQAPKKESQETKDLTEKRWLVKHSNCRLYSLINKKNKNEAHRDRRTMDRKKVYRRWESKDDIQRNVS